MVTSMLKTLAGKHDSTVTKMARRYKATVQTPYEPRRCFQVSVERGEGRKPLVARFGGIPLRRQKNAVPVDRDPVPVTVHRRELIDRLLAGRCELCEEKGKVQVHQVRKLADLGKSGQPERPEWMTVMANRRRKTLMVCGSCHATIHNRRSTASLTK